jgi:hypothetical protein
MATHMVIDQNSDRPHAPHLRPITPHIGTSWSDHALDIDRSNLLGMSFRVER